MPKRTKKSLPIVVPGIGTIEDNTLRAEKGVTEISLRTPGSVGREVGHHRQYVDILVRRTEEARNTSLSIREIVLPPSTKERRIILDVDHYRLLLVESIDFPENGKYAKGEKTAPEVRKVQSIIKKVIDKGKQ